MIYTLYKQLKSIADIEFDDIITDTVIICSYSGFAKKLRIELIDGTFIDIWYSTEGDYSFHWEQREIRNYIYRHDNAPHQKWSFVNTFPKHRHDGEDQNVVNSYIPDEPEEAIRTFLSIVKEKLLNLKSNPPNKPPNLR